jgi:hypothetical protein
MAGSSGSCAAKTSNLAPERGIPLIELHPRIAVGLYLLIGPSMGLPFTRSATKGLSCTQDKGNDQWERDT